MLKLPVLIGLLAAAGAPSPDQNSFGPHYNPSSMTKEVKDISKNAYGAFKWAPKAPKIGDRLDDFTLASTSGEFNLATARKNGPVMIVFYRGDW